MKKFKISTVAAIAIYAMPVAVFTSCNNLYKSLDNSRCMETVEKAYPKAKVYPLPDKEYRYIVIDTCGKVMYVRVLGKWDEISSVNVIQDCR